MEACDAEGSVVAHVDGAARDEDGMFVGHQCKGDKLFGRLYMLELRMYIYML